MTKDVYIYRYLNRDFKQDYHFIQGILKMIAHMIISQTFFYLFVILKKLYSYRDMNVIYYVNYVFEFYALT